MFTDPIFGTTDQETPLFPDAALLLLPDSVNCVDCPALRVALVGLSCRGVDEIPLLPLFATREITALALKAGLPKLVAVTVTVCGALMVVGAV